MPQRAIAIASLLLVMAIWGSAFSITKAAIAEVPPMTLALLRFVVALALLLPLALARHRRAAPSLEGAWLTLAGMGVCGVTLFYVGSNLALRYATATQSVIVQSVIPVVTALAAAFALDERLSGKRVVGILLSLAGVALVMIVAAPSQGASDPLLGGALMLGAVVAWSLYTAEGRDVVGRLGALPVIAWTIIAGTVLYLPLGLGALLVPQWRADIAHASGAAWAGVVYLIVMTSVVSYLIWYWALAYMAAARVAVFTNLQPLATAVMAQAFLGERISLGFYAAAAVVIAGVLLAQWRTANAAEEALLESPGHP